RRQGRLAKAAMLIPADVHRHHPIEHMARAVDRIHADPGGAAVRGLAAYRDDGIDAALVGERDAARGADHDDGQPRRETERGANTNCGVVSSGLPAVLTVKMRRPCKCSRSAAVFTAASAAANEPFFSDTPRPDNTR